MLTETQQSRCKWHLAIAACRIRSGVKRRLDMMSLDDLAMLCRHLNCAVDELLDAYWSAVRKAGADAATDPTPLFNDQ